MNILTVNLLFSTFISRIAAKMYLLPKMSKYRFIMLIILFVILAIAPSGGAPMSTTPSNTVAQDRAFSEFNHHLVGIFVLGIGILAFLAHASKRFSFAAKVWPFLFILPGLYLTVMSDPEVWPMGTENWINIFRDNPEAAQHKIYAIMLIAIGVIEFQRARGKLGKAMATWSFPLIAISGAVLLFFHEHGGAGAMTHSMPGMEHGDHMMSESMAKIKGEHFWFSMAGFGVIISKFVSDGQFSKRPFVPSLWPLFISILGILLILYTE